MNKRFEIPQLTPQEQDVLKIMLRADRGDGVWMSRNSIASKAKISWQDVERIQKSLAAKNQIRKSDHGHTLSSGRTIESWLTPNSKAWQYHKPPVLMPFNNVSTEIPPQDIAWAKYPKPTEADLEASRNRPTRLFVPDGGWGRKDNSGE